MDANTTSTDAAIAAKVAEINQAQTDLAILRQQAEVERVGTQLQAVADELGTTTEKVQAFLTRVSESSGYGLSYLVSVITREHRVSNGRVWE